MTTTESTTATGYANRIESAVSNGNVTDELQRISESIKSSAGVEAADRMLQEVTAELHARGALPGLVKSWAQANFASLDLDGNGSISAAELDRMLRADLLRNATNPLEKQLLRYMQANRTGIAAAHNDQWGTDSSITSRDLTEYEKQTAASNSKAVSARKLWERFGTGGDAFRQVDANGDGFLSEREIRNALIGQRGQLDAADRQLIEFMRDNRSAIAKSVNDQRFFDTQISVRDIAAFAQNNRVASMPAALDNTRDYSRERAPAAPAQGHLPDLILDFGRRNFEGLDLNGDGKITRAEIQKLTGSSFWNRGLSQDNLRLISAMDNKLDYIQRAHRDELWYKDRKGITVRDLEAYAQHEAQNRQDLPTEPGDHRLELTIGGVTRDYVMHIPPGYDGTKPVPIVYMFHYFTGSAEDMAKCCDLNKKADKEGFIVVYPNAKGWIGNRFRQWNLNNNSSYRVDEIAFVDTMMDTIEAKLNIDKDRVYVAGYSNGGMLAQEIAAKRSDRIAAMACIGGCQTGRETTPDYPVSTMLIHGNRDRIVPPGGRLITPLFPRFKPLEYSRDFWRRANGTDTSSFDQPALGVTREIHTNTTNGKQVIIYRHDQGHCWPGDPDPTLDGRPFLALNATDAMWEFFSRNTRAASPAPMERVRPLGR